MNKNSFILITGGVRSGKSSFAEKLAGSSGKKVVYLATARVLDGEMEQRVQRHRSLRPPGWETVEEPLDLTAAISGQSDPDKIVLLDCLSNYLSNLLLDLDVPADADEYVLDPSTESAVLAGLDNLTGAISRSAADIIIVTNEVGWGLVPPYPLGRVFRDLLGLFNHRLASMADALYLVICGQVLELKTLGSMSFPPRLP